MILSLEAVRQILGGVRLPRSRVGLTTIYSCGLRLQQGTPLQVPDIDSARPVIHVRHGQGGKDRYVPLPQRTLQRLRQYWLTHRHPVWIFPAPGREGIHLSTATDPLPRSRVQDAFRAALTDSGIHKPASVHRLRHSWATPLLEAGVNLRLIFRLAIINHRILKLEDGLVTFQYKDSATDQMRTCTVSAHEFIRRFLQHLLPHRFINVRYDGWLSPTNRHRLHQAREHLGVSAIELTAAGQRPDVKQPSDPPRCPTCGSLLRLVQPLRPTRRPTAWAPPTGRSPPGS